ncbi:extracellular solute-binding protein [Shouchella clausii]|uniref:extracellular solute-binding protein n=1 Tax=Shouchella TaxID=2893057 RepID=UPI0004E70CEA|nr:MULTISPECIES: extracellular solute-binding protein [Shouchella]MCM3310989.1 extracellular solute-binding protein [Psychrobacillus sp. MER TA 17]ALA53396.1 Ferric iron ABC transporter, iron-binding protein [Shouchella clausii]KKI86043.1 iron ABC transporter substrate-binding protein [Shouchella clausii]MBU3233270.1 extracellular solute-binding protein [Shouchella clausii]MBU3263910.1 extracellular solute-binding protein [Shouchella clausii]
MKALKKFGVVVGLAVVATGCGGNGSSGDDTLVVYTTRSESLNEAVIPQFEKETGIRVQMISAGTGEAITRVESERNNPQGDVLWAADITMLYDKTDLFEEYVSPEDEYMMEGFKNTTGYFSPAFSDPTVFIVNTDLAGDMEIESFQDLLNPELKGRIAFGDPVNSSSAFQSLIAMLYAAGDGDPMSDQAWEFVKAFVANLDGKVQGSSGQVHKGVADGEYVVGLTWEDPVVHYKQSGAAVEVVFPTEGVVYPGQSIQIIKGTKNLENAKKFVDYVLSEEVQSRTGQELTVRPLREGVEVADYMTPQEEIKLFDEYDEMFIIENMDDITARYVEVLEGSMD